MVLMYLLHLLRSLLLTPLMPEEEPCRLLVGGSGKPSIDNKVISLRQYFKTISSALVLELNAPISPIPAC